MKQETLKEKYLRFKKYTLRTSPNCKPCCCCDENIMAGEKYRDGRKVTNLAHEKCVDKIGEDI